MNAISPRNSTALDAELTHLPIFLGLRGRKALLIGGGTAALAKLDLLRRAGAMVQLVAPALEPILADRIAGDQQIRHCTASLAPEHFVGAALAIDASGSAETNSRAVRLARAAGIPLNVVDRPALCDFIMPAILDRAPVIVAVSTGGTAPVVARLIRQRLEMALPAGLGAIVRFAAGLRRLAVVPPPARFWEGLLDGPVARLAAAGETDAAFALAEDILAARPGGEAEAEAEAEAMQVVTVSSPDPELLTVRSARLIRSAAMIIYDPEIAAAILDLARREAPKLVATGMEAVERLAEKVQPALECRAGPFLYLTTGTATNTVKTSASIQNDQQFLRESAIDCSAARAH